MASSIVKHSKRTLRKACKFCGSKDVYWAHDTAIHISEDCAECTARDGRTVNGKWLLIDADTLTPHALTCAGKRKSDQPADPAPVPAPIVPDNDVTPDAQEMPVPAPEPVATGPAPVVPDSVPEGPLKALQALMDALAPKVDRNEVAAMVKEQIADVVFPTRTVVLRGEDDDAAKVIEGAHYQTESVLRALSRKRHVMMVGPAGTGKSSLGETAADALGLEFYAISCHMMMTPTELKGFIDATGTYRRTVFREAYEHGGVFLFDEIDNANSGTLTAMNAALANKRMAFPDGMVWRHPDFRVVAAANTYGRGESRKYQRQQLDAATLNRFIVREIEYDPAIERAMCMATGADAETVDKVIAFVGKLRANADRFAMNVTMGTRNSESMCALLDAGDTWTEAENACLRVGLSDTDWRKLTQ